MLALAVIMLGVTVVFGAAAAWRRLRRDVAPPPAWLAAAHGLAALVGFAVLLLALPGSHRGGATGTSSFGVIAAVLFAAALLIGLAMLVLRLRARRVPMTLVGIHATLAVSGFVVLAVYATLG
ncbi:MAG TPA: hypothetical protein VN802_03735 [Stellaceae bacterium]|nr:hypothetical protein [Stellaceae bacterium]